VGPFKVLERIGSSAYRVKLPERCRMHPVFHVSKLWKYNNSLSDPVDHAPILLEDEGLFEVQDILNKRGPDAAPHYLVQWKGYDTMYNTWEPADQLEMCTDLIKAYETRGPSVAAARPSLLVLVMAQCLPRPP
jgi:Chromo (CHRromatin Organisation MOdifier) domain